MSWGSNTRAHREMTAAMAGNTESSAWKAMPAARRLTRSSVSCSLTRHRISSQPPPGICTGRMARRPRWGEAMDTSVRAGGVQHHPRIADLDIETIEEAHAEQGHLALHAGADGAAHLPSREAAEAHLVKGSQIAPHPAVGGVEPGAAGGLQAQALGQPRDRK